MSGKTLAALLLSTGALTTNALAQSTDIVDIGRIVLDGNDLGDVDVTEEDLEQLNPSDLADIFREEPAIAIGSSIAMSQKLYVNGVEENNLAVTVDGSRQNNKIFHHNTTTLIDPDLLQAARVDPGVAPADAGPGALGGSVAYETKTVDGLLDADRDFGGQFSLEYDTNGDTLIGSTALYGRSGGFEYLGFLKQAEGNDLEDGNGDEILASSAAMLSGLGKVAYETENGDRFSFSYEKVTNDDTRPYRANIGLITVGRPVPETRNYEIERENFVFTYNKTAPQGIWDPKVILAYSDTNLDVSGDDSAVGSTDSLNGVVQNTFHLDNGTVVAGLDFYRDVADIDYVNPANPAWDYSAKEKARNIGLFAQARMDVSDRARVSFGGRYDFHELEGTDGSKFKTDGLSVNASGEYDVTDVLTLSAGASHVFAGIPLAENFIMNPDWVYPDDLDDTTSNSIYVAALADFGSWQLDGKAFQTDINDARIASWGGGPGLSKDLEVRGFELGARYGWNNGYVRVGYSDISADIDGNSADSYNGNYLTMPIGQTLTLSAVHALPDHGLTFGADAEIVFKENDTYDSEGGPGEQLPAYEVVNVFVEYQPRGMKNLTLRAEVNNLFDKAYAARATYGQEFGASIEPLMEPGRSIALKGTIRF